MKHRTFFEPTICPHCGATHDAHTAVTADARPEPGDVSVCIVCADVSEYGPDLRLRVPDASQFAALMADADVRRARAALRNTITRSA